MILLQELSEGWMDKVKQKMQDFLPVREKDIVPGAKFEYTQMGQTFDFHIVRVIRDRASLGILNDDGEDIEIKQVVLDFADLYDGNDEELELNKTDPYDLMLPKKDILKLLRQRNARRIK